jgi:hypothetical protein
MSETNKPEVHNPDEWRCIHTKYKNLCTNCKKLILNLKEKK